MAVALDRRAVILREAAELFAKQGVAGTTVREIADAAGILSGSLYHHFASKDEIVEAVLAAFMTDLRARYDAVLGSGAPPAERLRGLVLASLQTVAEHPHATEIYQNDGQRLPGIDRAAKSVRAAWVEVLQEGQASGEFRAEIPVKVLYPLLRDGLWQTARWFVPTRGYGHEQLAEHYVTLFLDGLVVPPARRR